MQSDQRFRAQVVELLARTLGGIAKVLEFATSGQQQIAFDQVRQAKIRLGLEQGINLSERQVEVIATDLLKHLAQLVVGALVRLGVRRIKEENAGEGQCPRE